MNDCPKAPAYFIIDTVDTLDLGSFHQRYAQAAGAIDRVTRP